MMKKAILAGLMALAVTMVPQAVSAAPFTGAVGYGGVWQLPDADGFDDEVQLGINSALVLEVEAGSAFDAAGMSVGDSLTHATPLVYVPPTIPAGALWSWTDGVNTIEFFLTSMYVESLDDQHVELRGEGYFTGAGYDQTDGVWAMTAQRSDGSISRATYSADSIVLVPEPATLALLGFGLIGVGAARRRSRR